MSITYYAKYNALLNDRPPFPVVEQLPGSVSKRPGTLQHRAF